MSMFGERDGSDYRDFVMGDSKRIRLHDNLFTLPTGFHKPWWYLPSDLLIEIGKTCPYMKYIYDPKEARFETTMQELNSKEHWSGRIGT